MANKMKKGKLIFINIILSSVGLFLNMGINMILTPYITENIGAEAYGYINLANTLIGYVEIISVALNSLAARYIAIDYHQNKKKEANEKFNSVLIADIILTCILLLVSLIFIYKLEQVISIPNLLVVDVKRLFLLVTINYGLNIVSSVFNVAAFIYNRMDMISFSKDVSYVIKAVLMWALFFFLVPHVWYVSVAVLVSSFFIVVFNICITRRLTPDLQLNLKKFKFRTVVEIAKNGVWNSISSLGVTLNSGLDLLITNNMLSSLAMGQLSICKSLITVFNTFVALFTQAFRPIQLEAYAHNDQDRMIHYFKISIKVTGYICIILFAGIVACGKEFLKLWVPSQDIDLIYKVILIIIIGDVVGAISYPLLYIFTIVNKLKIISLITVANGLINVTSMILLLKYTNLGIYAIVITTAVLNIVVQMVVTPLLATSYLKLSWYTFYPLITRCIVCGLLMTVCFAFVSSLISWNLSWIHLIIKAVFLVILGTIICLATLFSKGEISKIILLIKSRRNAVSDI